MIIGGVGEIAWVRVGLTNSRVEAVMGMVAGAIVGEARLHPTSTLVSSKKIERNLGHIISSREVFFMLMFD